jgi:hypothetical protein
MIEVVVACYKEDVSWTEKIPKEMSVTIYNKHQGKNLLPNVGRESHTYLTHIIKNYDNLPDFTLFVQGDPISHCTKFLQHLSNLLINDFYKKCQYVGLSDGLITCDGNGRPHCGETHLPVAKLYEYLFNETAPAVFVCNSAGQFGVSKEVILKNSKALYEKALLTLSYDVNPIEGFCMERLWATIFGFKSEAKRSSIQYTGDPYISQDTYDVMCTSKDGTFTCLGELGFKDRR